MLIVSIVITILTLIFYKNTSIGSETNRKVDEFVRNVDSSIQFKDEAVKLNEEDKVPPYHCETINFEIQEVSGLYKRKNESVLRLSESIDALEIPSMAKEQLALEYGVSIREYRGATSGFSNDYTELFPEINNESKFKTVSGQVAAEFNDLAQKKDYAGLIELIKANDIDNHTIIGGDSIISWIVKSTSELPTEVTSALIDLGIQPKFYDLYVATKYSVNPEQLAHLHSYKSTDNDRKWFEENRQHTLSTIALKNTDPEVLEFWISQGVPLVSFEDDLNASDTYIEAALEQKEVNKSILEELTRLNIKPYDTSNKLALLKVFPDDLKIKYPDYYQELTEGVQSKIELTSEMQQSAEKSRKRQLDLNEQIKRNEQAIEVCKNIRNERDDEDVDEISEEQKVADLYIAHEIMSYQNNGDWDKVLNKYYELAAEYSHDGILSFAIIDMINKGAPNKYIMEVALKGYAIPKEAVRLLIDDNNSALLRDLANYGLLSNTNMGEHDNAVSYAQKANASEEVIEILRSMRL